MRLWIDGELIFDEWDVVSSARLMVGAKYLEANRLYDIRVEYYEYNWAASCRLEWSSDYFGQEVIPSSQLYPVIEEADFRALIAPNPASTNNVTIHVESTIAGFVTWRIIDVTGRMVQKFNLEISPGSRSYPVDISPLTPGVYYVQPEFGIGSDEVLRLVVH